MYVRKKPIRSNLLVMGSNLHLGQLQVFGTILEKKEFPVTFFSKLFVYSKARFEPIKIAQKWEKLFWWTLQAWFCFERGHFMGMVHGIFATLCLNTAQTFLHKILKWFGKAINAVIAKKLRFVKKRPSFRTVFNFRKCRLSSKLSTNLKGIYWHISNSLSFQ